MYKFIQRHKKKFLAFFMVGLMVAFILPLGMNPGTGESTQILGKIGDEEFTSNEVETANRDLEMMQRSPFRAVLNKLDPRNQRMMDPMMGQPVPIVQQLLDNPEAYALLQREAKAAGISPNEDEINTLFTIYFQESVRRSDEATAYKALIHRFLLVRDSFQRTLADVKVTLPLVRAAVANQQSPHVNVVEFLASDYEKEVPEPTPEQIAAHYERYATVTPFTFASPAATQPVQFGYRKSDRLKLQYIELPADAVLKAAMADLKPAELDAVNRVAAAYYEENASQFQTTPASAPAATQITVTTAPAAPAGPTTKPFTEVLAEIQPKVLRGEVTAQGAFPEDVAAVAKLRQKVEAKADSIRAALHSRLSGDFQGTGSGLSAGPTTARSVDVTKLEYLETVANDIEKQTKVRPIVKSLANEWLTMKDLIGLQGINMSRAGDVDFVALAVKHGPQATPSTNATTAPSTNPTTGPTTTASTQPTTAPAKLATEPAKPAMALFEPSPLLRNESGDAYIFRLTAFEGEHVPTLDEAREQIVKDLKLTAAYEKARNEAAKLREAAGSSAGREEGGLPVQAEVTGKKLSVVGPIPMDGRGEIPGLDLKDPNAEQTFMRMTTMLVSRATAEQPHPSNIVDLPSQKKVLVMELRKLERPWTAEQDAQAQAQAINGERVRLLNNQLVADALASWFNPDVIAKRVGYQKLAK